MATYLPTCVVSVVGNAVQYNQSHIIKSVLENLK